jgi:hypothetical protein
MGKLVDTNKDSLRRGALIKFPASHPFEGMVVMMVWQEFFKALPMGLITITGYKAGINPYVTFPVEVCERADMPPCVPCKWLRENWNHWVWPTGDVNEVYIRDELWIEEL